MSGAWCPYQLWERAVHHQKRAAVSKKFGPMGTHDNDRPHSATLTQEKLAQMYWTALEHPPYSPDLSLCDYHMFGPLKEALGGQRFDVDEQLENFVRKWPQTRPPSFYDAGIKKNSQSAGKVHREKWKLCRKVRIFLFCKIMFQ